MNTYYDDDGKLTFDEAESIVQRFIRSYEERRCRVSSVDVARAYDIETTHHNLVRLNDALNTELDVARSADSRATQYEL